MCPFYEVVLNFSPFAFSPILHSLGTELLKKQAVNLIQNESVLKTYWHIYYLYSYAYKFPAFQRREIPILN